jgi:hypothetical protein
MSGDLVLIRLADPTVQLSQPKVVRSSTCCPTHIHPQSAARARADIAAATADDDADDHPASLSSMHTRTPVHRGSKLPVPPTTGKPNVWFSGLLSAPSLLSTPDESLRRTAPVAGLGCPTRPSTSSMLERDVPPMLWMRLCARARPSASDMLDTKTCKLCRELLPDPELELEFRQREQKVR